MDNSKSRVVEDADAMRLRCGDRYVIVQPSRLASLSPLQVDQPYRKSPGVPGCVPKVSVVVHPEDAMAQVGLIEEYRLGW